MRRLSTLCRALGATRPSNGGFVVRTERSFLWRSQKNGLQLGTGRIDEIIVHRKSQVRQNPQNRHSLFRGDALEENFQTRFGCFFEPFSRSAITILRDFRFRSNTCSEVSIISGAKCSKSFCYKLFDSASLCFCVVRSRSHNRRRGLRKKKQPQVSSCLHPKKWR